MPRVASIAVACFAAAVLTHGQALAAPPSVEAFAGAVGGVPTGHDIPGVCSTYGSPEPEYSFFPSSITMSVPQGGIAFCGYSGDAASTIAVAGPAMTSRSVGPVLLGNPGFAGNYTGSANAIADFKTLKAAARGAVTAPGSGTTLSLAYSSAAAIFDDTLTATSPQVTVPSAGFVRYTFSFDGSLSAPGLVMSGIPGTAAATLNIEHDGGPNFAIVRVEATRGSTGTLFALDGTAGAFAAGPGSISGSGSFTSRIVGQFGEIIDRPFTWGQPFRLKAGLMATVIGNGEADFASTARLVRIDFFDASHAPVTQVSIASASGTVYDTSGTSDAGAADAPPADTGADARADAADAQRADAPTADAADAGANAADAQLADAPTAGAPATSSGGGCATAGGDASGGVPLLLFLMVSCLGARQRARKTGANRRAS